jgi:hypothetical protein
MLAAFHALRTAQFRSREKILPRRGHDAAILRERDMFMLDERIGQTHTKPSGQMVVAGARIAKRVAAVPARLVAGRTVCGNRHDAFEHPADHR